MRWFQNIGCAQPFDRGAKSTDFSLQLAVGIQNFYTWLDGKDGVYNPPPPAGDVDRIVRNKPKK